MAAKVAAAAIARVMFIFFSRLGKYSICLSAISLCSPTE